MLSPKSSSLFADRLVLFGAAFSLLTIAFVGRFLFGSSNPAKLAFTHLHCPECLDEVHYYQGGERVNCSECKVKLIPTVGSLLEQESAGLSRWGRYLSAGILTTVVGQGYIFLCIWRWKLLRRREQEFLEQTLACHCPFCDRKLGYRLKNSGQGTTCPRCKTAFFLPTEDDSEPVDSMNDWEDVSLGKSS